MDEEAIVNSMFELADLWTDEISREAYVGFLSNLFDRISVSAAEPNFDTVGPLATVADDEDEPTLAERKGEPVRFR